MSELRSGRRWTNGLWTFSALLGMPPADKGSPSGRECALGHARAAQGKIVSRADAQPGASPAEPDLNGRLRYDPISMLKNSAHE